jgi:hypothetical protein
MPFTFAIYGALKPSIDGALKPPCVAAAGLGQASESWNRSEDDQGYL